MFLLLGEDEEEEEESHICWKAAGSTRALAAAVAAVVIAVPDCFLSLSLSLFESLSVCGTAACGRELSEAGLVVGESGVVGRRWSFSGLLLVVVLLTSGLRIGREGIWVGLM